MTRGKTRSGLKLRHYQPPRANGREVDPRWGRTSGASGTVALMLKQRPWGVRRRPSREERIRVDLVADES